MAETLEMWREKRVLAATGMSHGTLWNMVQAGTFPAPFQLNVKMLGWRSTEVLAWMNGLKRIDVSV